MESFFQAFGLSPSDALLPFWEEAKELLCQRGEEILQFERYRAFPTLTGEFAAVRDTLSGDEDALLYCYLLSLLLKAGEDKLATSLSRPHSHRGSETDDLLPLFALLDQTDAMLALHRKKNIPEEVSRDTVLMFENQVQDFLALYHHLGISIYFSWMLCFLRGRIFRIGRFNLERAVFTLPYQIFQNGETLCTLSNGAVFHKSGQILGSKNCEDTEGSFGGTVHETETTYEGITVQNGVALPEPIILRKSEWRRVLTSGDAVISVHIPSGGPLPPSVCDEDLGRGKALLDRAFGEHRGFYCLSWLLDPVIKSLLPSPTNMTRFADRFLRLPVKSAADSVYSYVWNEPTPCPPEALSTDTTLKRVLRDYLMTGRQIYGAAGFYME